MPDFKILEIVLDAKQVYIRREKVGSSTIGGDSVPPYQQDVVQKHFKSMLKSNKTRVDKAVTAATQVVVNVLELVSGTQSQADAAKKARIKKAENSNLTVLNSRR